MSLSKCHPEAAFAKGNPAHSALLALLWSAALVLGARPCVGAAVVWLVSDPPPQPLSAEKASVSFPPQWLPVLLGFHDTTSSPKTKSRVQLPGAGRVLNLAKVEVYSFKPPPADQHEMHDNGVRNDFTAVQASETTRPVSRSLTLACG